jgi:hypothetical protein
VIKIFQTIQADVTDCPPAIAKFLPSKKAALKRGSNAHSFSARTLTVSGVSISAASAAQNLTGRKNRSGSLSGVAPGTFSTGRFDFIHCSKAN